MKFSLVLSCVLAMNVFAAEKNCDPKKKPIKQAGAQQQECSGKGEVLSCGTSGYNASAAIDVSKKYWEANVRPFMDLSLTYWYAGEDGLALAETGILNSATLYYPESIKTLFPDFEYKVGFKLTAGLTVNSNWLFTGTYTWYRGEMNTSSSVLSGTAPTAGTASALSGTQVWAINDWFLQGTPAGQSLSGSEVKANWKLSMDLLDLLASRPFYQARRLIISPFAGFQLAFIRQWMNVRLSESETLFSGAISPQPIESKNHSSSWAIGPKFGAGSKFVLPYGLWLDGAAAASLLYTSYDVNHSEDAAATTFNPGPYKASYSGYTALRPAAEAKVGFGWGRYLSDRRYHLDLSADYSFMMFWSQNMIRKLVDDTLTGTGPGAGDLYFQGLTVTGRFDF